MKLHAYIVPNVRKYYGTEINLETDDGSTSGFNVWVNSLSPDYAPSEREYDFKGADGKYYIRDEEDHTYVYEYEISDDHYETQTAYDICKKIVEALDGLEI